MPQYDKNHDGTVSNREFKNAKQIAFFEEELQRHNARRRMAWLAMFSMIVFTGLLFTPLVTEGRVSALSDLLGLFYIAQAGVVGAYMGITAWMTRGAYNNYSTRTYQSAMDPNMPDGER